MGQREKDIAAVGEVLGKPSGFDISEPAMKVRKSLLAASIALLCLVMAKIEPSDTFTIFGVAFKGVTADKIVVGGILVLIYSMIHFLTYIVELIMEFRVRVTGAKVAYQTGARAGSQYVDYPDDPKQSSLSNWWKDQARRLLVLDEFIDKMNADLEEVKLRLGSPGEVRGAPDEIATSQLMGQVVGNLQKLKMDVQNNREVLMSPRIEVSLQRFETWHKDLISLQGLRVVVLEVAFPILLGTVSLALAVHYLYTH
ncbi:hypothetical protein ACF8GG_19585 [Pseudomonas sp. yb_1]|uniref:hypothetical protein n=1 Tax=Pseudomonas sp. yb_1 TaxID=3367217 RepID=UPI00370B8C04